ncbi:hypothetical protein LEMLEM_LOCUS15471, partial [Lemmus lemmus]
PKAHSRSLRIEQSNQKNKRKEINITSGFSSPVTFILDDTLKQLTEVDNCA